MFIHVLVAIGGCVTTVTYFDAKIGSGGKNTYVNSKYNNLRGGL